jgi:capsule polysaccharide export protein KpsE/RkpR
VTRLQREIGDYQRQLAAAGDASSRALMQSLLFSANTQLSIAQQTLTEQQLNRAKAEANEKPYIVSLSESPSRSSSAPNRLRTVVLAAIIGLLVGVIVTFVWRGSPAGRAGRE